MSTIKFDPSNPAVIVLVIGLLWMYSKKAKAGSNGKAIKPQASSTAPTRNGSPLIGDLSNWGKLVGSAVPTLSDWVKGLGSSDAATTSSGLYLPETQFTAPEGAAKALSDDLGFQFGGFAPVYNSDNVLGGSSFNGLPSVGTGLDPALVMW